VKNDLPEVLQDASLLSQLAAYSSGIRLQDVPPEVLRQARLNILDTIGCIASGARLPESGQLLAAERSRGGPAEATVLGSSERLPVEAATRINAYMGDVFELNDLIGGHASIATVVPALALAESLGASGSDLVEAVIAGIEVVCRVHGGFYAHQKPFTETAMVQVTIASASGAAAAAAKLMKLDATQTMNAMAIAAALTSWGPAELVFGEGNSLKPILFGGWQGAMGLVGANYARHGLTASSKLLESPIGYYATVARSHDRDVVLDFANWRLAQPRRKLHACCGYTHSAIDAVAKLQAAGELKDVARVRVHLPAYIIPAISKGGRPPTTPNEARFNIEYCLAQAAAGADVILPEHSIQCEEHLRRPEIAEGVGRFEVVTEPAFGHYRFCRLALLNADGSVRRVVENDAPRGSEWNPMSDEDVRAKFRRLAGGFIEGDALDSYIERVEHLDTSASVEWLLRSFG
jgi:2-methylcitrate dehydratase PrpD